MAGLVVPAIHAVTELACVRTLTISIAGDDARF
jgi:hypothetical protein